MDSRSMPRFPAANVFCAIFFILTIHGCESSNSSYENHADTATVDKTSPDQTDSRQVAEISQTENAPSVEPVDPQIEVKTVFQKLMEIRDEPDPDEWTKADQQLSAFGKTAVPTLIAELSNPEIPARELASMYLAGLGPEAKEAAPALENALEDESPFIQVNAASTLTHFSDYRDKAIPVLITLTKHQDPNTRLTAIYALGNLDSPSEDQLIALKTALNDPDESVQLATVKILGQIGQPAKAVLETLQTLIEDTKSDKTLREAALTSKLQIEQAKQ